MIDDEPGGGEAHEAPDEPLVHEANPIGREQAVDRGSPVFQLVGDRVELLISDTRTQQMQDVSDHDNKSDEDEENDHRVRDLVPHLLDHVEDLLHGALGRCGRLTHGAIL